MTRLSSLLAALLIAAACGDLQTSGALARPASASPSVAPSRTPRMTTATTLDCTVSWISHYRTLEQLTKDAEIVVRAVAVAQDEVRLRPGFARDATRPARRTTFRVTAVLRSAGTTLTEIRVLEDVCPNLTVAPGEEWVLEGRSAGQFRIRDGKVAGPFYLFADLVHSYEGAPVAELVADTLAIR
jgi:hypothetical protein